MYFHKMELKVWVEGIQRVICGVTEATTCQDVVIALAHATGKTGRFTLVERWRENERLLAPSEAPLRVLHKWGEYASDVQFILRHSDKDKKRAEREAKRTDKFLHNFTPHQQERRSSGSGIKKSLTFSGAHTFFPPAKPTPKHVAPENSSLESLDEHMSYTSYSSKSSTSPYASLDKQVRQATLPTQVGPSSPDHRQLVQTLRPSPQLSSRTSSTSSAGTPPGSLERRSRQATALSQCVQTSSHKQLHTKQLQPQVGLPNTNTGKVPGSVPQIGAEEYDLENALRQDYPGSDAKNVNFSKVNGSLQEKDIHKTKKVSQSVNSGQDDLFKLVKLQQERLSVQDSQLKILDSEIQYWEQREQDFEKQYLTVQQETDRLTQTERSLDSALQELDLVSWVDKLEVEKQHEKMLQSELTLVRSQLANAESELLAAKNKVHKLTQEVENGKREQTKRDTEAKEQEIKVLQEISELQKQINRKLLQHEDNQTSLDELLAEVQSLESAILEKKVQIADCEKELKEANMTSFITAPSTDWLKSPDGSTTNRPFHRLSPSRPGSARKMTHSPQLLKETVATTKNPHGMWV